MQACAQWTDSDVWSTLPTMPDCLSIRDDQQKEKKLGIGDWRAICNLTRGIDTVWGVIHHWGVSAGCDIPHPLSCSHSAHMGTYFAGQCDEHFCNIEYTDIGKSQRLPTEGNARMNNVSAMRPGIANMIKKVCISRHFERPETDYHIAENSCCIHYVEIW
jgi:hypothetical protein